MLLAKEATKSNIQSTLDECIVKIQRNLEVEKILFHPEVTISIAYCNSLFESGTLSRLECEKIKNGLLTILKRTKFDKNYFDDSKANNIYEFIDEKLLHLVGEVGLKINIGRSFQDRTSTVLRYWLKQQIVEISQTLREIQSKFVFIAEENKEVILIAKTSNRNKQPMYFGHWAMANFEAFQRDRERLDEVWRRVNTMPIGSNQGLGTSLEFDREELAKRLDFERISVNSLDAIQNLDFTLEFVNTAALLNINFARFVKELSHFHKEKLIQFQLDYKQEYITILRGKLNKIFAFQTELNMSLQSFSINNLESFDGKTEAILGTVNIIKNCLAFFNLMIENLSVNQEQFEITLRKVLPSVSEIFDYLVQRDEPVDSARVKATEIKEYLVSKRSLGNAELEELQKYAKVIEYDFFEELSVDKILNSKNQIGGTSYERVSEALEDAKKNLQYEE